MVAVKGHIFNKKHLKYGVFVGAGEQNRTAVLTLARLHNSHYTTPAYATLRRGRPAIAKLCRGKESDLRPLLFQSSALPLSYPGKFYNVGAMSSKSFPKALLPLRGTIQGIGSRHITPDIFKAAINGVLNILWAL